jgi:hypothetical protein
MRIIPSHGTSNYTDCSFPYQRNNTGDYTLVQLKRQWYLPKTTYNMRYV